MPAENTSSNGGYLDGFVNVLGALSEAYSEVVTADNSSASPATHTQNTPAVEGTGAPATFKSTAIKYWWAIAAVLVLFLSLLIWLL